MLGSQFMIFCKKIQNSYFLSEGLSPEFKEFFNVGPPKERIFISLLGWDTSMFENSLKKAHFAPLLQRVTAKSYSVFLRIVLEASILMCVYFISSAMTYCKSYL